MKKLLTIAVLAILSVPAQAAELPQKFWGEWKSIDEFVPQSTMILDGTTITFEFPPSCKFTEVTLANEDGTAYDVNWHCPGDQAASEIKEAFRLAKVHGRDILMTTNSENPTGISIYDRAARQVGKIEPIKTLAANPNYGKADDYGSERFAAINQCMIDRSGKPLEVCMANQGFVFCPDCLVFGNDGPSCKDDDHLHSWCWEQDWAKAFSLKQ